MAPLQSTPAAPGRPTPARDFSPVVLLAENDPTLRALVQETLELDRLRVLTAVNGEEALALAEASLPDLLVTDVGMPRLDGFGLIRALRRIYPDVPVIVTSGDPYYDDRPLETVAAELRVAALFLKPFDLEDLQRAVRKTVAVDLESARPPHRLVA